MSPRSSFTYILLLLSLFTACQERSVKPDYPHLPWAGYEIWTRTLTDQDTQLLKSQGLKNPVSDLKKDLAAHPEIIPFQARGGNRFYFYPNSIYILKDSLAKADFEDGHTSGSMLLRYSVKKGVITWEILETDCPDCQKKAIPVQ